MRLKPAFNGYKADYERVCPICKTPIFSKYKTKIFCDQTCKAISNNLSSATNQLTKKNLKFEYKITPKTSTNL